VGQDRDISKVRLSSCFRIFHPKSMVFKYSNQTAMK